MEYVFGIHPIGGCSNRNHLMNQSTSLEELLYLKQKSYLKTHLPLSESKLMSSLIRLFSGINADGISHRLENLGLTVRRI